MNKLISIIVPIYNIIKYLPKCIESILGQAYSAFELILVDDGSTDGCSQVCDEYEKKDARIKVVHKKNGGLVSARKAGLEISTGEYIGYVDGDDWISFDMYEKMYQKIIEYNADIVMCGRYEDTGDECREVYQGLPAGYYNKEQLKKEIYPKMIVNGAFFEWGLFPGVWDKLFKRECLETFQMEVDERIVMGEDAACAYPCLLNANSIYIMDECLYHYRQTTTSMIKQINDCDSERQQFHILYHTVQEKIRKYSTKYNLKKQWDQYLLFLMVPRADTLYKEYEKQDFLFPFPKVKKGMKIILYGAGTYGQRLYNFCKRTNFCEIVTWVDRNYLALKKMGLDVVSPSEIAESDCNVIVIANMYAKSRGDLYEELVKKYPDKMICQIDEKLIFSEKSKVALGLNY